MSRFWGWAPGPFLLSPLTQLLDATVLVASSSSWGGRVDNGWVTCQQSPHLIGPPWAHSSLEKSAAVDWQTGDRILV